MKQYRSKCVRYSCLLGAALALVAAGLCQQAMATEYHLYPGDSIYALTPSLVAGDTVILHAGTYGRFKIINRHGAPGAWITIKGAAGEDRPLIYYGSRNQNVIEVNDCSYIKLKGFDISGGSDGIKISASTGHYITYEDLYIHHVGDTGINMSGIWDVSNLTIRNCEIAYTGYPNTGSTGEGMYIGKHGDYNRPQVHDSLIEHNYVHDMASPTQGDGIELKHGCNKVIVQDNVVSVQAQYAAITTYATGKNDPAYNLIVRRNLIYNSVDCAIYCRGGEITIENNIIVNAIDNGINSALRDSDGAMKHMRIINNTIYRAGSNALALRGWNLGPDLVLANNAVYQASPGAQALNAVHGMSAATVANNYYYGTTNWSGPGWTPGQPPASTFIYPSTTVSLADLYPKPGSWLIDAGNNGYAPPEDFSFLLRPNGAAADIGAYEVYSADNPGWPLDEDFKDTTAALPGDTNGDGTVNLVDVLLLAHAWGTCQGDANYNSRADFNGDGCINLADVLVLAGNWGVSL